MKRNMKFLNSNLLFCVALFVGCNKKVVEEKHFHPVTEVVREQQPNQQGTETHGGNITPSAMMKLYDYFTITEEDVKKKEPHPPVGSNELWYRGETVKGAMFFLWKGIELRYKAGLIKDYNGNRLNYILGEMFREGPQGNIFTDIENTKYDIKFTKKLDWMDPQRASQYQYGVCIDINKEVSAAAAKLNDRDGDICVNANEMVRQSPGMELPAIWGILSHEHAHHFGFTEQDSVDLQNFVSQSDSNSLFSAGEYYEGFLSSVGEVESQPDSGTTTINSYYDFLQIPLGSISYNDKTYSIEVRYKNVQGMTEDLYDVDKALYFSRHNLNFYTGSYILSGKTIPAGFEWDKDCQFSKQEDDVVYSCNINKFFERNLNLTKFSYLTVKAYTKRLFYENQNKENLTKISYEGLSLKLLEDGKEVKNNFFEMSSNQISEKEIDKISINFIFN